MACDDLVYRKLKALVDERGSWRRVADHFGVHPTFISNIIAGIAQPSASMCRKMGIVKKTTRTTTVIYEEKPDDSV